MDPQLYSDSLGYTGRIGRIGLIGQDAPSALAPGRVIDPALLCGRSCTWVAWRIRGRCSRSLTRATRGCH